MGVLRRHLHHHRLSAATAVALLFFASASASAISPARQLGNVLVGITGVRQERGEAKRGSGSEALERVLTRRRLGGPGSSPPTCRSKCGRCLPCKAVRVPIQPGRSMPLEYYPEAWRCKCGNKYFMP